MLLVKNPENKLGKIVATEPLIASGSPNGDNPDVKGLSKLKSKRF